jgi:chromosomal replication initiation ATPase DnaA
VLREKLHARYLDGEGVRANRELIEYLAARATPSVRDIVTTVRRLVQAARAAGVPLTAAVARAELEQNGTAAGSTRPQRLRRDALFLDREKVVWDWPDIAGRVIEEFR